ncbi:hypothetical protein OO013_17760 [Mangrovivirga sp. M17]|uniref:Uncharacterized protein n=1 Tax=Mangrovivirga halotolerans TaxID=2993936 RepID=A0ABT3RWL9_9BACT|nr:hypothetical protein [Mangrovivirga halotolerans]MCX2745734.1 hypothetical protein [Mangrovivirga halotolerans]
MARPNRSLISALRKAAKKLNKSDKYQWGHMGSCNCGFLAQEITKLNKGEIHAYAMQKYGDWTEQAMDYCTDSKQPFDLIINTMVNEGLTIEDLIELERLKNKEVLKRIPNKDYLKHNKKEDVVKYMNAWADLLEEKLKEKVSQNYTEVKTEVSKPVFA